MHVERRAVRVWDPKAKAHVTVTVSVACHITAIAEALAAKAMANKSGMSREIGGAVEVRVIKEIL